MRSIHWAIAAACVAACSSSNTAGDQTIDAPQVSSTCGDGICAPDEIVSCPQDCGSDIGSDGSGSDLGSGSDDVECAGSDAVCGNGVCEPPCESATNCPGDCGAGSDGSGSASGLNCDSKDVEEACIWCLGLDLCIGTGISIASCDACALGG